MTTNCQNKLEHRLRERGINPTAMRNAVLAHLLDREVAVSLHDLETAFPRADRSTLYRTLRTFEKHGLIHPIPDENGVTNYALCERNCSCRYPDDLHVHFLCRVCSRVYCFPDLSVPEMQLPESFQPRSGNFVINGFCSHCAA